MKNKKECPFCDGMSNLIRQPKQKEFRNEMFDIIEHFYKCVKCNEEYTTTEIDNITINQIYNQYRAKFNIPFPEEIRIIRKQYELSASKMSEVLGLGINSYRNYEKGEMPKLANAKLIQTAKNPLAFRGLINEHLFSKDKFDQLKSRIDFLLREDAKQEFLCGRINIYNEPNIFTGFRSLDLNRIKNIVVYFLTNTDKRYTGKLKLNKLLFYADFFHFKKYATSLSGLAYRTIKYGPVPSFYGGLYSELVYQNVIEDIYYGKEQYDVYKSLSQFDGDCFSQDEIKTLEVVADKFADVKPWDLVDISHKEDFYENLLADKEIVNYMEYAFRLKAL